MKLGRRRGPFQGGTSRDRSVAGPAASESGNRARGARGLYPLGSVDRRRGGPGTCRPQGLQRRAEGQALLCCPLLVRGGNVWEGLVAVCKDVPDPCPKEDLPFPGGVAQGPATPQSRCGAGLPPQERTRPFSGTGRDSS